MQPKGWMQTQPTVAGNGPVNEEINAGCQRPLRCGGCLLCGITAAIVDYDNVYPCVPKPRTVLGQKMLLNKETNKSLIQYLCSMGLHLLRLLLPPLFKRDNNGFFVGLL